MTETKGARHTPLEAELLACLKDMTRIVEAVRYSAGISGSQLERLARARAAIAKATQP